MKNFWPPVLRRSVPYGLDILFLGTAVIKSHACVLRKSEKRENALVGSQGQLNTDVSSPVKLAYDRDRPPVAIHTILDNT